MASGLAVTGVSTLLIIGLADRFLDGVANRAAINVWWVLVAMLVTPFGVIETYLARTVIAEVAAGRDPTRVIAAVTARAWTLAGLIMAGTLGISSWLSAHELAGHRGAALLLPVFTATGCAQAVQRGLATARGRFTAIAVQLSVDGVTRVVLAVSLLSTGQATVTRLAAASCLASLSGLACGARLTRGWLVRPRWSAPGVSWRPILLLLMASSTPLLLSSGPATWLQGFGGVSRATVVAFAAALALSRVPLQFAAAVFSPLLTQFTTAVERGDVGTFERLRRQAALAAAGAGALFVLAFSVVGHATLPVYAGSHETLSYGPLALLACLSALLLLSVVLEAGLAARGRWERVTAAWLAALLAVPLALLVARMLHLPPVYRASVAPVAAVTVAIGLMAWGQTRARHSSASRSRE